MQTQISVGVFQRPGPPKKHPSKFKPQLDAPVPKPQVAPPTVQPTAQQVAQARKQFGDPKPGTFEKAVRERLKSELVTFHKFIECGSGKCVCRPQTGKIPLEEVQRMVTAGEAKWLISHRQDGTPYRANSVVSFKQKKNPLLATIRVHGCFNPITEIMPETCRCQHRVNLTEANALITAGKASWLKVERDGQSYEMHTTIILSAAEVERRSAILKDLSRPEGRPIKAFKIVLLKAASKGWVKLGDADLNDDAIWDAFKAPELFCSKHPELFPNGLEKGSYISPFKGTRTNVYIPQGSLSRALIYNATWFWDRLLTGENLDIPVGDLNEEPRGVYMTEDGKPKGQMTSGGDLVGFLQANTNLPTTDYGT